MAQAWNLPGIGLMACALTIMWMPPGARAQEYPAHPIRVIVPFPAGSAPDIVTRFIGRQLTESIGQTIVVDPRPGAAGTYGTALGAKASPDGYTLTIGILGPVAIRPSLDSQLAYDPVTDFAPVTLISYFPNVLLVNPAAPYKTVKELIAVARAKPGQLNYASAGSGTLPHLSMELFSKMAGIKLVHIPYKGVIAAVPDLIGGQPQLAFANISTVLPYLKSGRLSALAVTSAARAQLLPDTPTIAEAANLPGFETNDWFGFLVPTAVPRRIVTQLHAQLIKVLQSPEIKAQLADQGGQPVSDTPAEFAAFIKSEIVKWKEVIRFSGARLE